MATLSKKKQTQKRHFRARKKISGTEDRPRLAVYKSNKHISVQIINDDAQHTLCAAASYAPELKGSIKKMDKAAAEIVGKAVAEKAIAKGIKKVVFDHGGNLYHGRIKALADAARKEGLEF